MIRKSLADYPLVIIALLLTAFGIAVVYSAGQSGCPGGLGAGRLAQAADVGLGVGVGAFLLPCTRLSVRFLEWVAVPAYALSILLLVVTLLFSSGAGTAASMKEWLTIGGVRLGQPSELSKLAVTLMLAKLLASCRIAPRSLMGW